VESKSARREKYFFYSILVLISTPLVMLEFFPTLDGIVHLHNANLINSLVFENSRLQDFYEFNDGLLPNWTGHLLLALFNLLLPGNIAEKIFLLLYVIGLPVSFRQLVLQQGGTKIHTYLIFPFIYTSVLYLGFYNFCIALVFIFIALRIWLKLENDGPQLKYVIKLSVLLLLIYFSHIFVFLFLILLLGCRITWNLFTMDSPDSGFIKKLKVFSKILLVLAAVGIIPAILSVIYFINYPTGKPSNFYSFYELTGWIKSIRPIIGFSVIEQEPLSGKIFYVLITLFIIILYERINGAFNTVKSFSFRIVFSKLIRKQDFWLFAGILCLILLFIAPDSDGYSGYVSIRICLLFFLFFILWICLNPLPKWLTIGSVTVVLLFTLLLQIINFKFSSELNEVAGEIYHSGNKIPDYKMVLPISFSDNWLHLHFSNYLGVEKKLIILENYECGTVYFPLKWKLKNRPNIKNSQNQTCGEQVEYQLSDDPDYIFILGTEKSETASCEDTLLLTINKRYSVVEINAHSRLLKKNIQ
jgi:hypothetical protein